uniref:Galectin n=3 Tax=Parascaris univalens TaxID=6257 RepID=A0A915A2J3_PARUN
AHDNDIKQHHRGDHWCSIHIRIVRNNYQVFYDGSFFIEFPGGNLPFHHFMRYSYIRSIVVSAYNIDQFIVDAADGTNGYFVNRKHRISYGRVQQVLHAGEKLFTKAFIGSTFLYYCNEHEKQDESASVTLLHSNNFAVLRIDLFREKDMIMISAPEAFRCGVFYFKIDYIFQLSVKILCHEFQISIGGISCAVIHHHDPNDIAAFEISGNIEPVRYDVVDIGSS